MYDKDYEVLAYYSRNIVPKDEVEERLWYINTWAAKDNIGRDVRGRFLMFDDIYFEVIEGTKKDIDLSIERIQKDDRHKSIDILFRHKLEDLTIPRWKVDMEDQSARQWRTSEEHLRCYAHNFERNLKMNGSNFLFYLEAMRKIAG
jgi:hypothetical protein